MVTPIPTDTKKQTGDSRLRNSVLEATYFTRLNGNSIALSQAL